MKILEVSLTSFCILVNVPDFFVPRFQVINNINVLGEVDLFKVLNSKSLYDSISTWKLQYLIDDFFKSDIRSNSWDLLWDALTSLNDLYKFFIAASEQQFEMLMKKINASSDVVDAHKQMSDIITKLFSPSHKSYLVSLDVELFHLLLKSRIKPVSQSELFVQLISN